MKTLPLLLLGAAALAQTACGPAQDSSSSSQVSSILDKNFRYEWNLGSHLSTLVDTQSLPEFSHLDDRGLSLGDEQNFFLASNFVVQAADQRASASYHIDASVLAKRLSGRVFDVTAAASANNIEADFEVRALGRSFYSVKASSVQNFKMPVLDYGVTLPYAILPALSVDLGGKIGGEAAFTMAPRITEDGGNVAVMLKPQMKLVGSITAGASALFARAEAVGRLNLLNASWPVIFGLGYDTEKHQTRGLVEVKDFKVNSMSGGVDLVASLSVGNILPEPARKIWRSVLGNRLEYTYPLVKYDGYELLSVPGKQFLFQ